MYDKVVVKFVNGEMLELEFVSDIEYGDSYIYVHLSGGVKYVLPKENVLYISEEVD